MRKFLLQKGMILMLVLASMTFLDPVQLMAQSSAGATVSGTVQSSDGEGLPGVAVILKGTSVGTVTDINGKFSIKASPEDILRFSFIGMISEEVTVGSKTEFSIVLMDDLKQLDEVVVVGYGTVQRKDLTGSVASVNSAQIKDIPLNSAAEALTGRLAGVHVTTSEGSPGAEIQIRVRGGGSITQDNSPLYIVDGIQIENALAILSPQEIQSVDVLKDAAATAIYGSRGANGVVIITTKGGKEMPTQVSYNGFAGVRQIVRKLDVLKPYDFVMNQYELYNRVGSDQSLRNRFANTYGTWDDLDIYRDMPFRDWQDDVFGRDAWNKTHVLNVTGGNKSSSFNINLNRVDEDGIMLNSGFERTLVSFKFDHKATKRLKVGVSSRYSRQVVEGAGTSNTGSQGTNRLRNTVRYRPYTAPGQEREIDIFDSDFALQTNLANPVLLVNNEIRYDRRNDLILNGWASFDILENLTFKSVVGVTNTDRRDEMFNGTPTSIARQFSNMPVLRLRGSESLTINNSNVLTYKPELDGIHKMDFLLGQEIVDVTTRFDDMTIRWLPVDITAEEAFAGYQKATPPSGAIQEAPSTALAFDRLVSFFGRANYSYADKYLATATLRYDGSSKFHYDNGFAAFPSLALAWRLSGEDFMSDINTVSDLKLRASFGSMGNNRIGNDLFRTMYISRGAQDGYAIDNAITPGLSPNSLANSGLMWETTISRNIGIDFSVFGGRLNASVDAYLNNTKDLLMNQLVPVHSGYANQIQNVGRTQNKGIEVQLDGFIVNKKDFQWKANFNIAFNRNKVVDLGLDPFGNPINSFFVNSGWTTYNDFFVEVGQPIGNFYGYVTDGFYKVDDFNYTYDELTGAYTYTLRPDVPNSRVINGGNEPQPGDLKLKKLSDSESMVIGDDDKTILGSAQPLHIGGINQQFLYKNWDMSIFMNWSYGNKVYNANNVEYTTHGNYTDNNMLSVMENRWRSFGDNGVRVTDPVQLAEMNQNTQFWTPSRGHYMLHSFAIEDGSFLRLSNLTVGYSVPQSLLARTKIFSSFRVYGTVNNLFVLTKYTGYDPEANTRRSTPLTPGVDYSAFPRSRFILGGVNITF